jgi:pyridoxamine 5'-phosphate oxidase
VLRPTRVEFWQGRPSRLHDRLVYELLPDGHTWEISRLAP